MSLSRDHPLNWTGEAGRNRIEDVLDHREFALGTGRLWTPFVFVGGANLVDFCVQGRERIGKDGEQGGEGVLP